MIRFLLGFRVKPGGSSRVFKLWSRVNELQCHIIDRKNSAVTDPQAASCRSSNVIWHFGVWERAACAGGRGVTGGQHRSPPPPRPTPLKKLPNFGVLAWGGGPRTNPGGLSKAVPPLLPPSLRAVPIWSTHRESNCAAQRPSVTGSHTLQWAGDKTKSW